MFSRKKQTENARKLCANLEADDGVDPRDDRRRDAMLDRKPDRKLWQLCKQVAQSIHFSLGALPNAEVLAGVVVREVRPAPNASRLCVVLDVFDVRQVQTVKDFLTRNKIRLRADVAMSITRSRVPELVFAVYMIPKREANDR